MPRPHGQTMPQREDLTLHHAASHLLEECRMVLPGIQALFGFQLVVVFNSRFPTALSQGEQQVHYVATVLVALAVALVMAPAAWHRQVEPRSISQRFVDVSSRMLLWSMLPLAIAISLEVYLIGHVILNWNAMAVVIGSVCFLAFALAWLALPEYARHQRKIEERKESQ